MPNTNKWIEEFENNSDFHDYECEFGFMGSSKCDCQMIDMKKWLKDLISKVRKESYNSGYADGLNEQISTNKTKE